MNLLEVIQRQIESLPDGPYLVGLQSVVRHVETAFRHLSRGQTEPDESAFTDAVYRTNQAFEGSIKEAYRVLADRDPTSVRPFDIENYLQENATFRPRVLTQFTAYRREWRNPSTHDYTLDFDEDEAFLAIVSVSDFAKLLIDQISEKVAFNITEAETRPIAETLQTSTPPDTPLARRIASVVQEFLAQPRDQSRSHIENEYQLAGALSAYLSAAIPGATIRTGEPLQEGSRNYADMIVDLETHRVVLELKISSPRAVAHGLRKLQSVMLASSAEGGLLVLYSSESSDYRIDDQFSLGERIIGVIGPSE